MSIIITQEIFESRVEEIYEGRFSVIGKYINTKTPIEIQCNKCGKVFSRTPNHITSGGHKTTCPRCRNKLNPFSNVTIGVNDMWHTHPEVAENLKDKEDGYRYTAFSTKPLMFVCPKCGSKLIKKPNDVTSYGLSCNYCSDTIKYPNRFMGLLLYKLDIPHIPEYRIYGYGHYYRYDFFFEFNNKKYLIEMDGSFGHGCINTPSRTIEQQIEDDRIKDQIAIDNGFTLIRIDCKYSTRDDRFHYVASNILNSEFAQFIPHYTIDDLDEINEKCIQTSLVVDIADDWNSGIQSYDELSEKNHVSKQLIRNTIKRACNLKLINETYKECSSILRRNGQINRREKHGNSTRIICIETGMVYESLGAAREDGYFHVWDCLNNIRQFDGTLPDGTKLTWKKITEEEYLKLKSAS